MAAKALPPHARGLAPAPEGLNSGAATELADADVHPEVMELRKAGTLLPPLGPLLKKGGALNNAMFHTADMMKSEVARVDGSLADDFGPVLRGSCVYLHGFLCKPADMTLFRLMKEEVVRYVQRKRAAAPSDESEGAAEEPEAGEAKASVAKAAGGESDALNAQLLQWSKHQVFENPTEVSAIFNDCVRFLSAYFDLDVYATRLNYYRDGTQWKPYHHDSHAYGGRALREDFTAGLSLGHTRALNFLHEPSGQTFSFPQINGDCFAFTNEANQKFKHGVPRAKPDCGDRMSIIAWGRRRALNERNGGPAAIPKALASAPLESTDDALAAARALVAVPASEGNMGSRAPSAVSDGADADAKKKAKKKNRLQ